MNRQIVPFLDNILSFDFKNGVFPSHFSFRSVKRKDFSFKTSMFNEISLIWSGRFKKAMLFENMQLIFWYFD